MKNAISQIKIIIKKKQYWRFILTFFYFFLPKNFYGDYLFSYFDFYLWNKRLPSKSDNTLNSFMFYYKCKKDQNELKTFVSCKINCKIFLKNLGLEKYIVPTIKILNNINEVKNYEIKNKIICKPSHYGGGKKLFKYGDNINPVKFNNEEIETIKDWLRWDYYKISREKNYKNIQKKIILEPILFNNNQITDFKIWTFNHKVKMFQIVFWEKNKRERCFYNLNWEKMPFSIYDKPCENTFPKPKLFDEMIKLSEKISKNFKFLRVDLYTNDEEIFVGELTNHPGNHGDIFLDKNGNYVGFENEKKYSKLFLE